MARVLSRKGRKPVYVYDSDSGMMKRVITDGKVRKREEGSVLCCASPIIITKSVEIGRKQDVHIVLVKK